MRMPAGKSLCLGAVGCCALLVAALYVGLTALSACMDRVGPPVRCSLAEEEQRAAALEADHVLLTKSMQVTAKIREDLVAGRLTLGEAVTALAAENATRPARLRIRTVYFPGDTEEERLAHGTVERLARALADRPDRATTLARLQSELEEFLADRRARARPTPTSGRPGAAAQPGPTTPDLVGPSAKVRPNEDRRPIP
jgi:hypothetical protein